MNVAEMRSEFLLYIVDADYATAESILNLVSGAGYDTRFYPTIDSALMGARELPPHLVLFNYDGMEESAERFLSQIQEISPEILTIMMLSSKQIIPALQLVERGLAFDTQARPFVSSLELIQKLDRAAQRLYFQFESEQLREALAEQRPEAIAEQRPEANAENHESISDASRRRESNLGSPQTPVVASAGLDPDALDRFLATMSSVKDLEQTIQGLLDAFSAQLHNVPCLYFKYIPHYLSLVLSHASWLPIDRIRGIGVELKNLETSRLPEYFEQPSGIEPLSKLIAEAFRIEKWTAMTHYNDGDALGVIVIFDPLADERRARVVKALKGIFDLAYRRNLLVKEKHALETHDHVTGVLNRKHFRVRLDEEISRARRIAMPLSLIVIDIDRFKDVNKLIGISNADTVLKMVGVLLRKTTRTNDIVARIGADELVVLLPHTDHMGAAVKAERIRRILESTRFPALEGKPVDHLTVSVGVSEYPGLAGDAEGLVKSADEALFQVKEAGGNRVCLATPVPGFVPDFVPRPRSEPAHEPEHGQETS